MLYLSYFVDFFYIEFAGLKFRPDITTGHGRVPRIRAFPLEIRLTDRLGERVVQLESNQCAIANTVPPRAHDPKIFPKRVDRIF